MRYTITILLLSFLLLNGGLQNASGQCKGNLIFYDEFDGSSLDGTKWSYETGNGCPNLCGWGNNEKEYYTSQNVSVTGGNLNITAKYAPNYIGSGSDFTSGKINTKGKFDRLYGRFEARMKMPVGKGLWPAFWLLPTDNAYGGWPTSGEIDIVEYSGDRTTQADATLHYGNGWPNNLHDGTPFNNGTNYSSDFHIFAVEWQPGIMKFFVDNNLIKTETQNPNSLNPASNNAVNWPWDKRYYILLNMAVGGWFTGNPTTSDIVNSTTWPQTLLVDYVRVYDMATTTAQSPYGGTVRTIPGKIEAEHYNVGCEGSAYHDTDAGNTGGAFRGEDVDIEACTDGGSGYDVGWTAAGEWLNYNVNVSTSGLYNIQVRLASQDGGKKVHVELDGVNVSGTINVGATGSWTTYQTFSANNVNLTAGNKTMKLVFEDGGVNCNYVNFATVGPLSVTLNATSNTANTASLSIAASGGGGGSGSTVTKVEYYDGSTKIGESTTSPFSFTWSNASAGSHSIKAVVTDGNGGTTTSNVVTLNVRSATGVIGNTQSKSFNIYPNPTHDIIHLSEDVKAVGIYTISGKKIEDINLQGQTQIDLSSYTSGVYLLQIITEDQAGFIKVSKE